MEERMSIEIPIYMLQHTNTYPAFNRKIKKLKIPGNRIMKKKRMIKMTNFVPKVLTYMKHFGAFLSFQSG